MFNATNGEIITNANSDNMLSQILGNFETQYIIDVVRDSINMRFRPYSIGLPGLNAIEQNFQNIINGVDDYSQKQKTMEVREQTYQQVIDIICEYFNLSYTPNDDTDIYAIAYYLYDLLVANFTATIVNFFTIYILRNQEVLYKQIAGDVTKDMINNYSKKMYNNQHLGIIHSLLSIVMDNISVIDISLSDILNYAVSDINEINIIMTTISDNDNLFRDFFTCYLKNYSTRTDLITVVKLALQNYANNDLAIIAGDQITKED